MKKTVIPVGNLSSGLLVILRRIPNWLDDVKTPKEFPMNLSVFILQPDLEKDYGQSPIIFRSHLFQFLGSLFYNPFSKKSPPYLLIKLV